MRTSSAEAFRLEDGGLNRNADNQDRPKADRYGRHITFRLDALAISKRLFGDNLRLI